MDAKTFLDWSATQDDLLELIDGKPVVVRRERTRNASTVASNALMSLLGSSRKAGFLLLHRFPVVLSQDVVLLPDIVVVDDAPNPAATFVELPRCVIEILDGDEARGTPETRQARWMTRDTLQVVAKVDPDFLYVGGCQRRTGGWRFFGLRDPSDQIATGVPGLDLSLGDVYDGLALPRKPELDVELDIPIGRWPR